MQKHKYIPSPKWAEVRKFVVKRDNNTCRCCGIKKTRDNRIKLHVHHLCYIQGVPRENVHPDYLVTLCPYCHKVQHQVRPIEFFRLKSYADVTDEHFKLVKTRGTKKSAQELKWKKMAENMGISKSLYGKIRNLERQGKMPRTQNKSMTKPPKKKQSALKNSLD